jgi:hypothetical protein
MPKSSAFRVFAAGSPPSAGAGAVRDHLERAQPQPLVAEAGVQPVRSIPISGCSKPFTVVKA